MSATAAEVWLMLPNPPTDPITDTLDSFPPTWGKKRTARPADLQIVGWRPLGPEDIEAVEQKVASGVSLISLGAAPPTVKALRLTHHRLAQLLAMGMDEVRAALLCNYQASRVSVLKADPAFQDLLTYYKNQVDVKWGDFVTTAKVLSMDFLSHLRELLDETPEKFTPAATLEAIRVLADRSGNGAMTKSVNLNVNTGIGDRLNAARARLEALDAA